MCESVGEARVSRCRCWGGGSVDSGSASTGKLLYQNPDLCSISTEGKATAPHSGPRRVARTWRPVIWLDVEPRLQTVGGAVGARGQGGGIIIYC